MEPLWKMVNIKKLFDTAIQQTSTDDPVQNKIISGECKKVRTLICLIQSIYFKY